MKTNIFILLALTVIIFGSSLVLFVYKISWFPPHHRNMIIERNIIFSNMTVWMNKTYLIIFIIIILVVIILIVYNYIKKEKN